MASTVAHQYIAVPLQQTGQNQVSSSTSQAGTTSDTRYGSTTLSSCPRTEQVEGTHNEAMLLTPYSLEVGKRCLFAIDRPRGTRRGSAGYGQDQGTAGNHRLRLDGTRKVGYNVEYDRHSRRRVVPRNEGAMFPERQGFNQPLPPNQDRCSCKPSPTSLILRVSVSSHRSSSSTFRQATMCR